MDDEQKQNQENKIEEVLEDTLEQEAHEAGHAHLPAAEYDPPTHEHKWALIGIVVVLVLMLVGWGVYFLIPYDPDFSDENMPDFGSASSEQDATSSEQGMGPGNLPIAEEPIERKEEMVNENLNCLGPNGLPPDPGEAGMETVEGIDCDGDGVRDDVQRYIRMTYSDSEITRVALTEIAKNIQLSLVSYDNGELSVQLADEGLKATECLYHVRSDDHLEVEEALYAVLLNTPNRNTAFLKHNNVIGGSVFHTRHISEYHTSCHFDVDAYVDEDEKLAYLREKYGFSMVLPEGWSVAKEQATEGSLDTFFLKRDPESESYASFDFMFGCMENSRLEEERESARELIPITIGGQEFTIFSSEHEEGEFHQFDYIHFLIPIVRDYSDSGIKDAIVYTYESCGMEVWSLGPLDDESKEVVRSFRFEDGFDAFTDRVREWFGKDYRIK